MVPPPWRIVTPPPAKKLYYLHDRPGLVSLAAKLNVKVFDLELQVGYEKDGVEVVGNTDTPLHVDGWTSFHRLVYLRHIPTGRIEIVHGSRQTRR